MKSMAKKKAGSKKGKSEEDKDASEKAEKAEEAKKGLVDLLADYDKGLIINDGLRDRATRKSAEGSRFDFSGKDYIQQYAEKRGLIYEDAQKRFEDKFSKHEREAIFGDQHILKTKEYKARAAKYAAEHLDDLFSEENHKGLVKALEDSENVKNMTELARARKDPVAEYAFRKYAQYAELKKALDAFEAYIADNKDIPEDKRKEGRELLAGVPGEFGREVAGKIVDVAVERKMKELEGGYDEEDLKALAEIAQIEARIDPLAEDVVEAMRRTYKEEKEDLEANKYGDRTKLLGYMRDNVKYALSKPRTVDAGLDIMYNAFTGKSLGDTPYRDAFKKK
jgi:hypothetical protein